MYIVHSTWVQSNSQLNHLILHVRNSEWRDGAKQMKSHRRHFQCMAIAIPHRQTTCHHVYIANRLTLTQAFHKSILTNGEAQPLSHFKCTYECFCPAAYPGAKSSYAPIQYGYRLWPYLQRRNKREILGNILNSLPQPNAWIICHSSSLIAEA